MKLDQLRSIIDVVQGIYPEATIDIDSSDLTFLNKDKEVIRIDIEDSQIICDFDIFPSLASKKPPVKAKGKQGRNNATTRFVDIEDE